MNVRTYALAEPTCARASKPALPQGENFAVKSYQSFRLLVTWLYLIAQFWLEYLTRTGNTPLRKQSKYSSRGFFTLSQHDLWDSCSEGPTIRPRRDCGNRMT
jgi:hypothetical protein